MARRRRPTTSDRMTKMTPTVLKNHHFSAYRKRRHGKFADILNQNAFICLTRALRAMAGGNDSNRRYVFLEDFGNLKPFGC